MFDSLEMETRKRARALHIAAKKGDKRAAKQARRIVKSARKARQ